MNEFVQELEELIEGVRKDGVPISDTDTVAEISGALGTEGRKEVCYSIELRVKLRVRGSVLKCSLQEISF